MKWVRDQATSVIERLVNALAWLQPPMAQRRAHASASTNASNVGCSTTVCDFITRSTVRQISGNRQRPWMKASTATSFAALSTAGRVPPVSPAQRARFRAGKSFTRGASKCSSASRAKSSGTSEFATRSGQVTAYWMGKHMSEWLSCAMTLLSMNSTILWTMD